MHILQTMLYLQTMLAMYTSEFEIVHGFRQKNMVADRLADITYSHRRHLEYYRDKSFPRPVRRFHGKQDGTAEL